MYCNIYEKPEGFSRTFLNLDFQGLMLSLDMFQNQNGFIISVSCACAQSVIALTFHTLRQSSPPKHECTASASNSYPSCLIPAPGMTGGQLSFCRNCAILRHMLRSCPHRNKAWRLCSASTDRRNGVDCCMAGLGSLKGPAPPSP